MKFTSTKEELSRAVSQVGRVVSTKTTLPILRNIYIETKATEIIFRATDLEQTLEVHVEGKVAEPGKITIPARLLMDYFQNLFDTEITLQATDTDLAIISKSNTAHLKGMPAEEYPTQPPIKGEQRITLPASTVYQVLDHCLFATATDDSRPILSGLLFRFTNQQLTVVGTDGYRLALQNTSLNSSLTGDYIIPRRSLIELQRLVVSGEIELVFSPTQVSFTVGSTQLMSRILDGAFPAYEAIIPTTQKLTTKVNASELLQGLKLVSLFSRDSAYSVKVALSGQKMEISATSSQFGDSINRVNLMSEVAEPLTITINAQYLIDVLQVMTGVVELSFLEPDKPVVVKSPALKHYTYLLMPLRGE